MSHPLTKINGPNSLSKDVLIDEECPWLINFISPENPDNVGLFDTIPAMNVVSMALPHSCIAIKHALHSVSKISLFEKGLETSASC
jgi:hypothetical protein